MHPVARKLSGFADLSSQELHQLEDLFRNTSAVRGKADIVHEMDTPAAMIFLIEGVVARVKILADGGRQILALMLPGDACDHGVTLLAHRDHGLATLTPAIVAAVSRQELEVLLARHPRLRDAFQWASLVEESIAREWLTNVGRRAAPARIGHVFCEHHHRMRAIGLTDGRSCALPMSQVDLADATSVSAVHANRALKSLRNTGTVEFSHGILTILDLQRLEHLSDFSAGYLHHDARYHG